LSCCVGLEQILHSTHMQTNSENTTHLLSAIQKFYDLNDDMPALLSVSRRVFFEFLRTKPTLTTDDIDRIYSVIDLVNTICLLEPRKSPK
jgi:hypothetical protein